MIAAHDGAAAGVASVDVVANVRVVLHCHSYGADSSVAWVPGVVALSDCSKHFLF